MELIRRLAIATGVNVAALAVTAWAFDRVHIDGWGALDLAGVVFGIVNTVVKPVITFSRSHSSCSRSGSRCTSSTC